MSGLKSNLLFKQDPNGGDFLINPKYRLVYLHKVSINAQSISKLVFWYETKYSQELTDCLAKVARFGKVVVDIENFIQKQASEYDKSTQTYEAFIQCLIEFVAYYKATLNDIATILEKKGR